MRLGTWGSYGIEKLKILPGEGWEGLTITATFVTPNGSTRVLMQEDCLIDVPQEATSQALTPRNPGKIVFAGMDEDEQRITYDLLYLVTDHAPVEGEDSHPTPSEFAQFVAQVQGAASDAKKSATEAADSATQACQSAEKADKSAQSAEEALEQVQATGNSALQSIGAAKSDALSSIGTAQTTAVDSVQQTRQIAVQAVEQAGTTQVGAVNTAGQTQKTAIQQAGEDATTQVQDAGKEQVNAVNTAGDAKLQQIEEVNALLPTPTEADAGKAPIAQPDGTYALQEVTVDAYTKAESDARYAPIEAAIKVSGKGTGLVSLSPTVGWGMQGMTLYGKSWQDGTPSVETEVPIQDAGQDGSIDVTVCGANLLNMRNFISGPYISIDFLSDSEFVMSCVSAGAFRQTKTLKTGIIAPKGCKVYLSGQYTASSAENIPFVVLTTTKDGAQLDYHNLTFGGNVSIDQSGELEVILVMNQGNTAQVGDTTSFKDFAISFLPVRAYVTYSEPQQLPIPTPDGLPGIPVNSGGTWTDENGQQWVSDVVDLAAGTKTQYCGRIESYNGETITTPYISSTGALTTGAQVVYILREPVTTPLDADTLAAYRALQTYPGTTNIIAPDCGMEATAVGDANAILESITTRIAALEQNAVGGTT